jgi:hypothetical protein
MDAVEWDSSTDPEAMVRALPGLTRSRKAQLFVCACTRQGWHLLADERLRAAVEVAERFVDDAATYDDLRWAYHEACTAGTLLHLPISSEAWTVAENAQSCAHPIRWRIVGITRRANYAVARSHPMSTGANNPAVLVRLLRDVFGNPFRPVAFDRTWQAGPVTGLAEAAYEYRDLPAGTFDPARLAVLADALEENGAGADILAHLRGPGPHVRGCWAADLLLGKE